MADEEDEIFAHFIESEVLSDSSNDDIGAHYEETDIDSRRAKRFCLDCGGEGLMGSPPPLQSKSEEDEDVLGGIVSGFFTQVPSELYLNILKFLSSEDLISCSGVCRFLNYIAADESLWRRLYRMRWGLKNSTKKHTVVTWKMLYFQRDEEDMIECVRNCPVEFKEYYVQMQSAKRSEAPLPSQLNDIVIEKTLADQISSWKKTRGLAGKPVPADHACSAITCSYYQIADVFICERTGAVHVCGEPCREVVLDSVTGEEVCTISGHCFAPLISADSESDEPIAAVDEAEPEPFMGSGRYARAYQLGYNCADEEELEYALRFC